MTWVLLRELLKWILLELLVNYFGLNSCVLKKGSKRFSMPDVEFVNVPLNSHFILSSKDLLEIDNDIEYMNKVPF